MEKDFRELRASVERLRRENEKYGKLTIAIDFDDTLCCYDVNNIVHTSLREENKDICDLVRSIGDKAIFILWTCRSGQDREDALEWIKNHNIPIHAVDANPMVHYGGRKIHANLFLDDRAGLEHAYSALQLLYKAD